MCNLGRPIRVREVSRQRPIIAYRVWRIGQSWSSWTLMSTWLSYQWKPDANVAHAVPSSFNGNGLHAWRTFNGARTYYKSRPGQCNDDYVIGAVKLWGQVVEHEHGYRARYGRVVELLRFTKAFNPRDRVAVKKAYRVK